jgi:hypothetical protein
LGAPTLLAQESVDPDVEAGLDLCSDDWSGIREAYQESRHAIRQLDTGFSAFNPGQRWVSQFDGRGFTTTPLESGWTWGLQLEAYGFEGVMTKITASASGATADGGQLTYDWDPCVDEWYKNDERGLEHGYTVHHRPLGAKGLPDERLRLVLSVRGELTPELIDAGRGVRFLDSSGATKLTYSGLLVFDAEEKELDSVFLIEDTRLILVIDEARASYPLTIDPVAQQAYLKASNTDVYDNFGWKVAASGNTVVVGAPWEDSGSVGVNGVQGNDNLPDSGAAYVFVRTGATWSQEAYLKASNTDVGDHFGTYLAIDGDTIVVGAQHEDSGATGVDGDQSDDSKDNSGAAYVFVRSGGVWSQQAYLKASNSGEGDEFGYVSISGDLIAVCSELEDSNARVINGPDNDLRANSGAVYVFSRTGSTWAQEAYIKSSNSDIGDSFGVNAIEGETLVVCARGEDGGDSGINTPHTNNNTDSGAAYVFERNQGTWVETTKIKSSNPDEFDFFGISTDIAANRIIIGCNGEDSASTGVGGDQGNNFGSGGNSGAVYSFVRAGNSWAQESYIKAPNTGSSDQFGVGVALTGQYMIVGAWEEDSSSFGVDGDQLNNSAPAAGAAYVLSLQACEGWSHLSYLKASNAEAADNFGLSVALGDGFAVVGAPNEDSLSQGVNGTQGNGGPGENSRSGAAYGFDLTEPIDLGVSFCEGDGSSSTCPCFNFGSAGAGCANSAGGSALLYGEGAACSGLDSLVLRVSGSMPNKPGLLFQGINSMAGGNGNPLGNGLICVAPQRRWDVQFADDNGGVIYGPGVLADDPAVSAGAILHYQWWYRDAADTCGGGFNFSNAYTVIWE